MIASKHAVRRSTLPAPPARKRGFERWFAGSKVVTSDGAPCVVFHGTRSPVDFEIFETGRIYDPDEGETIVSSSRDPSAYIGPHFTESIAVAERFACGNAARWDEMRYVADGACGGRIIPVYLAIKNPKKFSGDKHLLDFVLSHGSSSEIDTAIEIWGEEDEAGADLDAVWSYNERGLTLLLDHEGDGSDGDPYEDAVRELGESARNVLREKGFDGVRYINTIEGGGASWIVFDATQIKSAIGNRGSFDPNEVSIVQNPRRRARCRRD